MENHLHINNHFIPYEQALELAKELGFNWECFGCYTEDKQLIIRLKDYRSDRLINEVIIKDFNSYKNDTVSAPLWQQAFDWFREKYNLIIYMYPYFSNEFQELKGLKPDGYRYIIFPYGKSKVYETYQEARQDCLEKLIEIVKQKNKENV